MMSGVMMAMYKAEMAVPSFAGHSVDSFALKQTNLVFQRVAMEFDRQVRGVTMAMMMMVMAAVRRVHLNLSGVVLILFVAQHFAFPLVVLVKQIMDGGMIIALPARVESSSLQAALLIVNNALLGSIRTKLEARAVSNATKIAIRTKKALFVSAMLVLKRMAWNLALLACLDNTSRNGALAFATFVRWEHIQNRLVQHHVQSVQRENFHLTQATMKPRIALTVKRVNTQNSKAGPIVLTVHVASFRQLLELMPKIHV